MRITKLILKGSDNFLLPISGLVTGEKQETGSRKKSFLQFVPTLNDSRSNNIIITMTTLIQATSTLVVLAVLSSISVNPIQAFGTTQNFLHSFHHHPLRQNDHYDQHQQSQTSTSLYAIGVFARKAKEAELRNYVQNDITDSVLAKVEEMKANLPSVSSKPPPTTVKQSLTKRKGTITVIAEYKRKLAVNTGYIDEEIIFSPLSMSPTFREFGASATAIMADERMGGCTYDDLDTVVKEQQSAQGDMPGPLPVINSDLIVDELQIARSAALGVDAVVVTYSVVEGGSTKVEFLIQCAYAVGMEVIVKVTDAVEAQGAVDVGARILWVDGVGDDGGSVDEKSAVVESLNVPEGETVCTIANILANNNKQLEEVEEAWICRDRGFNAVWVSDALYKQGNDPTEHAGAIIQSMTAKSSVKWASAKAKSGKGEGATEYLGDILM